MKTKTFNNTWIRRLKQQETSDIKKLDSIKRILKLFIPILAITAFTIVIIWALEISNSPFSGIKEKVDSHREDFMLGPKLFTNNYKNKPIEIRANSVKKIDNNEEIIVLDHPNGNTFLSKENIIKFSAKKGIFNRKLGKLNLYEEVHIWSSNGTNFFTENISYDINNDIIKGNRLVTMNGPWGSLKGKGFVFKTRISTITIAGRPLLHLKTKND